MTLSSIARIRTEKPWQYMGQLCKHFAHKIPATYDETQGDITFPMGACHLEVHDGALQMTASAADADALHQVEQAVKSHLERFSWKETPVIEWSQPD